MHRDECTEALDVVIAEKQPPRQRLVIGHRGDDDDQNEIRLAGDVVALLDLRRGGKLAFGLFDLFCRFADDLHLHKDGD